MGCPDIIERVWFNMTADILQQANTPNALGAGVMLAEILEGPHTNNADVRNLYLILQANNLQVEVWSEDTPHHRYHLQVRNHQEGDCLAVYLPQDLPPVLILAPDCSHCLFTDAWAVAVVIATVDGRFARLQARSQSMVIERNYSGYLWGPWEDVPVCSADEESK